MIPVTTFAGKTVAVFGLGASGVVTAKALLAGGAEVAAWDDGEAARIAAEREGVPFCDLRDADWSRFAALVLAPGVPLTHPEPHWTVRAAKAAGVEVIGDVELFCRERRKQPFDVPFIAITGTNGKSTTTALVAHILKSAGLDAQMGGNIGTPILALEAFAPGRHYVIECSSFQIDLSPTIDPTFAALLNITPDHLDRHGTFEKYAAIKERLIASVRGEDEVAVGLDDETCRDIFRRQVGIRKFNQSGRVMGVSGQPRVDDNGSLKRIAFAADEFFGQYAGIFEDDEVFVDTSRPALRGAHNRQNITAALAATFDGLFVVAMTALDEGKVKGDLNAFVIGAFKRGVESFPGLPHRMEEIGRAGRALFINDSKATNADSTGKALLSWDGDIYWIAGGRPKEGGIAPLAPLFPRVAKAYLIGEATDAFADTLAANGVAFERCGTLDVAVASAARDTSQSQGDEPVVLLSPACASYDQFKNFEVRGDAFRKLVSEQPGVDIKKPSATPSLRERGEGRGEGPELAPHPASAPHPNASPMNGERESNAASLHDPSGDDQ